MIELADRVRELLGPRNVADVEWRGRKEPLPLALPASIEEIQELVRWAAIERVRIAPIGLGSKLGWSRPPDMSAGEVLVVSTRRLQRLVEYEPGEGVITALAGTRMSTLRALVGEHGHWLTPDVPNAENATLGGVIAAGQSGLDRLRHGPARHHVLGVRVVMADGTIAKSGGRLVKNVTGFDLPRLFTGSRGAFGVIVEATLRLSSAPQREAFVTTVARDKDELVSHARALSNAAVRPIALVAARHGPEHAPMEWSLFAHLGGRGDVVQAEIELVEQLWRPTTVFAGADGVAEARRMREIDFASELHAYVHVTSSTSALPHVLRVLEDALREREFATRTLVQPLAAIVDVQLRLGDGVKLDAAHWIDALPTLRRDLAEFGATLDWRNPTRKLAAAGVPWPALGPGAELMRRIRDNLDPGGVFARGRFEEDL